LIVRTDSLMRCWAPAIGGGL